MVAICPQNIPFILGHNPAPPGPGRGTGPEFNTLPLELQGEILLNTPWCRHTEIGRVSRAWRRILQGWHIFLQLQTYRNSMYKEYNGLPIFYNIHVAGEFFAKVGVSLLNYIPRYNRYNNSSYDATRYKGVMIHDFLKNTSHDIRFPSTHSNGSSRVCPFCQRAPAEDIGVYHDGLEYFIPGTEQYYLKPHAFSRTRQPDISDYMLRHKNIPELGTQLEVPRDRSYNTYKEDPIWRTRASQGLLPPEQLPPHEREFAFNALEFEVLRVRDGPTPSTIRQNTEFTMKKPYGQYFRIRDMMDGFEQWIRSANDYIPCAKCMSLSTYPEGSTRSYCIVS